MKSELSFIAGIEDIIRASEFDVTAEQALIRLMEQTDIQGIGNLKGFFEYAVQFRQAWEKISLQQVLLSNELSDKTRERLKALTDTIDDDDDLQYDDVIELEILSEKTILAKIKLDSNTKRIRVENIPPGQVFVRLASGLVLWQQKLEIPNLLGNGEYGNLNMAADTCPESSPDQTVMMADGRIVLNIFVTNSNFAVEFELIE